MTVTVTRVPQSEDIDQAAEFIEACVTRMTKRGWQPNADTGEAGQLCLANTLAAVALEYRKCSSGDFPTATVFESQCVRLAQRVLDQMVTELHPCECDPEEIRRETVVPHYNDYHCRGREDAIELYRAAIKELRSIQG